MHHRVLLSFFATAALAVTGCETVLDVSSLHDRDATDASEDGMSVSDAGWPDAADANTFDAPQGDGADATVGDAHGDSGIDAGIDSPREDSGTDAVADAVPDATADSAADTTLPDSGAYSASDAGIDAGLVDAGLVDAGTDSPTDAGMGANVTCDAGLTACNGACVDLATDTNNCTLCGNVCGDAGNCTVTGCLVTLATGQNQPLIIALQGGAAYWNTASGLVTVGTNGGTASTIVAGNIGPIAVDSTNVYWSDNLVYQVWDSGVVMMAEHDGGSAVTIASGQRPTSALTVTPTTLYWANASVSGSPNTGAVVAAPLHGAPPTTLVAGLNEPFGIAADNANVYWTDFANNDVRSVSESGGDASVLEQGAIYPRGIAIDSTFVYWTTENASGGPDAGGVWRVSLDGGATTPLALGRWSPEGIALGGEWLYWVDTANHADGGAALVKMAIDGGAPVTLVSNYTIQSGFVAVDDASVYFATEPGANRSNASIMRLTPR